MTLAFIELTKPASTLSLYFAKRTYTQVSVVLANLGLYPQPGPLIYL